MDDLIEKINKSLRRYRRFLDPWEPDILSAAETGSRVVYMRDAINEALEASNGKVDLRQFLSEIRRLDTFMREHAAEIWEWCKYD